MVDISYSIAMFRSSERLTSAWSGGVTTEIAIYPEDAEYRERNFIWRMSTATVEAEKTSFTPLPGIWRLTMVTEGEMALEHEGHHRVHLKPYEQDSYSGEWTTQSTGKVKDFNLMMAEGCEGKLQAIPVRQGIHHEPLENHDNPHFRQAFEAFYCVDGTVALMVDGTDPFHLANGDLVLITRPNADNPVHVALSNKDVTTVHVIKASIYY